MSIEKNIHKVLVCSTSHISQEDDALMTHGLDLPGGHVYYQLDCGYLLVPCAHDMSTPAEFVAKGWSTGLFDLLKKGVLHECYYIRLDGDAPEVEGLKTYEWE